MKGSSEGGEMIGVSQKLTEKYWEMGELRKNRTESQTQGIRWGQEWDDCDQRGKKEGKELRVGQQNLEEKSEHAGIYLNYK